MQPAMIGSMSETFHPAFIKEVLFRAGVKETEWYFV